MRQVDHLVETGIITPAVEAPRRGMSRLFDARNLAEMTVGIELIKSGIKSSTVFNAIRRMTNSEHWPALTAGGEQRDQFAVLVLLRMSGVDTRPTIQLLPEDEVGRICNRGYTIMAAVPVAYVLRLIEKEFPGVNLR